MYIVYIYNHRSCWQCHNPPFGLKKHKDSDFGDALLLLLTIFNSYEIGGVLKWRYPPIIHFRLGFFHEINHLFWGTSMTMETPIYPLVN